MIPCLSVILSSIIWDPFKPFTWTPKCHLNQLPTSMWLSMWLSKDSITRWLRAMGCVLKISALAFTAKGCNLTWLGMKVSRGNYFQSFLATQYQPTSQTQVTPIPWVRIHRMTARVTSLISSQPILLRKSTIRIFRLMSQSFTGSLTLKLGVTILENKPKEQQSVQLISKQLWQQQNLVLCCRYTRKPRWLKQARKKYRGVSGKWCVREVMGGRAELRGI